MKKTVKAFVCRDCGFTTTKKLGCGECYMGHVCSKSKVKR